MPTVVESYGRLLVDNMEFRWIPNERETLLIARIARAVNCGAIKPIVEQLTKTEVDDAALPVDRYVVGPYAHTLTSITSSVPLLAYRNAVGKLILLDGRQRAESAFEASSLVNAYVIQEDDISVGRHPDAATAKSEEPYTILTSTHKRPVVFDHPRQKKGSQHRQVVQISYQRPPRGRPRSGWRERRIVECYGYFALVLICVEEIIRDVFKVVVPYDNDVALIFPAEASRFHKFDDGNSTDNRLSARHAYLLSHWAALGLREHCLSFNTIDNAAAEIVRNVTGLKTLGDLRNQVASGLAEAFHEDGLYGISECRNQSVDRLRLFAKAYVRAGHWRPARRDLIDLENRQNQNLDYVLVETTARFDLDNHPSLVGFEDMVTFSRASGIVATDVWLLFLKWNTYFEATAFLHRFVNSGHLGPPALTPTFVEATLHRHRIRNNGEKDYLSERWDPLLDELESFGLSEAALENALTEIDARGGVDPFDRNDVFYERRPGL